VVEEVAKACTLSARILVEANMGGISAVMAYGTDAQRAFAAPIVLTGDKPAICITEPEAGSAATDMQTTARRDGDHYALNGTKHWITGGGVSKLYLIFAQMLDDAGHTQGIAAFLVHHDPANGVAPEGFNIIGREHTMGLCGMPEAELRFDNLRVPADMLLMPPSGIKRGFADLMTAYNSQRVGAGTIAMGVAAGALEHAKRYLKERHQFGRPIGEFQGLQWMLADMDMAVHASRLMLHEAAKSRGTAAGTHVPRRAHVHHRRRHGPNPQDPGGRQPSGHQDPATPLIGRRKPAKRGGLMPMGPLRVADRENSHMGEHGRSLVREATPDREAGATTLCR